MITIYSGPVSWFSRKVEIALGEKALPYTQVLVPFSQTRGYYDRPEPVTRINPKRQVPVLIDGDVELYDSRIIMAYLDEAYPAPAMLPEGAAARARCRMWEEFADEVMLKPIRALMHRTEPHDHASTRWQELERDAADAMPLIAGHFATLDNALKRADHLCGDFSVADIACFMAVFWSKRLAGPPLAPHKALAAWYQRLLSRPCFAKAVDEIMAQDRMLSAKVEGATDTLA